MKKKLFSKISFKDSLIIYTIGALFTIISFIYFNIKGYPFVETPTETLNIRAPPIYMIPIFFPFGILLGEILIIWKRKKERNFSILLFCEFIIIGIISFIRYAISIPLSGHSLMIFFYLSHQLISNKNKYPVRTAIGIIVLILTMIFKLYLWNDPITFFIGAIVGFVVWIPGFIYTKRVSLNGDY